MSSAQIRANEESMKPGLVVKRGLRRSYVLKGERRLRVRLQSNRVFPFRLLCSLRNVTCRVRPSKRGKTCIGLMSSCAIQSSSRWSAKGACRFAHRERTAFAKPGSFGSLILALGKNSKMISRQRA